MEKGKSIITNFGCYFNCAYCIMKSNKIDKSLFIQNTDLQLNNLKDFIGESKKISVSGGGDPFYKYVENNSDSRNFWDRLLKLKQTLHFKIDVHTRITLYNIQLLQKINKYVLSIDNLTPNVINFITKAQCFTKIRLIKVIDDKTTLDEIDSIYNFCKNKRIELSFKECVEIHTNNELFLTIKNKFKNDKNVFIIDYNDYNVYLMPNGSIKYKFLDERKTDIKTT